MLIFCDGGGMEEHNKCWLAVTKMLKNTGIDIPITTTTYAT